jgi:putative spermidine/putrescine transport system permease protein
VAVTTAAGPGNAGGAGRVVVPCHAALWRRPWARATILLTPPLAWFVLIYLAALAVLLITAFWQINPFTTNIERVWSLGNLHTIVASPAYRGIILRTVGMAAAVTLTDAIVALPFAYFMARIASGRTRTIPFMAILLLLVGGTSANFMGNIIYSNIGIANNVPFAAAMALFPIAIMAIYLLGARALAAFEEI